ncbi:MAG: hypothetical protein KAU22_00650 [Desulfuromonadales bacterium]|nr:hypothetical protein [Desulfuromonadales bacterium]
MDKKCLLRKYLELSWFFLGLSFLLPVYVSTTNRAAQIPASSVFPNRWVEKHLWSSKAQSSEPDITELLASPGALFLPLQGVFSFSSRGKNGSDFF